MVEVVRREFAKGFEMFGGTLAAFVCLGCLTLSGWLVLQWIQCRDEIAPLWLMIALPQVVVSIPMAWWVPADAWEFAGTVYAAGFCLLILLRLIRRTCCKST